MRKNLVSLVVISLFSLFLVSSSGATAYAPDSFGDAATHSTQQWQKLGVDGGANDGVQWSLDGINYTTWGTSDLNVKQGDEIHFKFTYYGANYGQHPYDDLGVWVDLDGNGIWSGAEENLLWERISKGAAQIKDGTTPTGGKTYVPQIFSSSITIGTSFTTETDLWLRARVSCSESVAGVQGKFQSNGEFRYNYQGEAKWKNRVAPNFGAHIAATGDLWQGETEDYKIRVAAPVPIPGAMWLLGSGLLGLIGVRRKRK